MQMGRARPFPGHFQLLFATLSFKTVKTRRARPHSGLPGRKLSDRVPTQYSDPYLSSAVDGVGLLPVIVGRKQKIALQRLSIGRSDHLYLRHRKPDDESSTWQAPEATIRTGGGGQGGSRFPS